MMATVTSHTLNAADGTHASGIAARLVNMTTQAVLFETATDAAGRLNQTIDLTGANPTDRYELTLATGPFWTAAGQTHPQIVDEIVLRFSMPDPQARYHMPLILSPNGYSTWRSQPE
ncbi:MAG TPA: 5-hydroxyisourate hydrolase [Rhodobacteraceae bacterium]|jgi:5-hydroxyisourate hydrolase|nr:hydroxyisourate hydrolase [Pseudomonadota bacterium]NQW14351.1 hydroxyisourate hydrolase [Rhodobacter sp.]HBN32305.1 5-hydroxyisourate hydrolase [Paracoccaceae bacterium]